jgi:hypothetical protein
MVGSIRILVLAAAFVLWPANHAPAFCRGASCIREHGVCACRGAVFTPATGLVARITAENAAYESWFGWFPVPQETGAGGRGEAGEAWGTPVPGNRVDTVEAGRGRGSASAPGQDSPVHADPGVPADPADIPAEWIVFSPGDEPGATAELDLGGRTVGFWFLVRDPVLFAATTGPAHDPGHVRWNSCRGVLTLELEDARNLDADFDDMTVVLECPDPPDQRDLPSWYR